MPRVNARLEEDRQRQAEVTLKERGAKQEIADNLIALCRDRDLPWHDLPMEVRERVCRIVEVAPPKRGFCGLAERLDVNQVDQKFYQKQAQGVLRSGTDLMLEGVEVGRRRPVAAADILQFLRDNNLFLGVNDVASGVQATCAHRRQGQLLRHASGSSGSEMDSGIQSSIASSSSDGSGREHVGVIIGPADIPLVQSIPVRRSTPTDPADCIVSSDDGKPIEIIPKEPEDLKQSLKPTGPRLLLTYAGDGRQTAFDVADRFKELNFRVLLLEKQERWRLPDPYTAVQKWFTQVDYVIPLLTPQYLAATQNRAYPPDAHARRLAEDVRFVYSLMCAEMENNGHVNWRVRALVPDKMFEDVRGHPLYGSPLFRWPFQVSSLEELAECISE